MNETQRKFRKEMKRLNEEGHFVSEVRRPKMRRGIGINPFLFGIIIINALNYDNLEIMFKPNQEIVGEYMVKARKVDEVTEDGLRVILNEDTHKDELVRKSIEVVRLKDSLKIDNLVLEDYKDKTVEQLSVVEEMLAYSMIWHGHKRDQEWVNKYNDAVQETNRISRERYEMMLDLFKNQGIQYTIFSDGEVQYRYLEREY